MPQLNPLAYALTARDAIQQDRDREMQQQQRRQLGQVNALLLGGMDQGQPREPGQEQTNIGGRRKAIEFARQTGDPGVMQAVAQMDEQSRAAAQQRAEMAGGLLGDLLRLDPQQRVQVMRSPQFLERAQQAGFTPEQVMSFEPTDENIQAQLAQVGQLSETLGGSDLPTSVEEFQFSQQNPEFMEFLQQRDRSRGTQVNVTTGTSQTPDQIARERTATATGDAIGDQIVQGATAQRNLVRINRLDELLSNVETGGGASLRAFAGNFGIETEGLSDIQAAQAVIAALIPEQRPPGSGEMSDADLELFKQSLPRIINQPGGNELILETMRGIANYDMQLGQIAQDFNTGQIDLQEYRRRVNSLSNPIDRVRDRLTGGGEQPDIEEGATATNPQTGERIIFRNGRWEPL